MNDWFAVWVEMTEPLTPRFGDDPFALDDTLIDRLVNGVVDEPLPGAYRPVVGVLAAARRPGTGAEVAGEADAVAMFRAVRPSTSPTRRSSMSRRLLSAKTLLAAGALTVASATGAAAATGSLPGVAQETAATMLAKIGISVPGPDSHSGDRPDTRGRSDAGTDDSTTTSSTTESTTSSALEGRGETISGLATDPATTGIDKAKAVSAAASDGHSQAGTNGPPSSPPVGPPSSLPAGGPPSSTPVGPPSSLPAGGPPSSLPAGGPPSSLPAGGPPSSLPAGGPPSSLPAGGPPSSLPAGPPSSEPGAAPRP